MEAQYGWALSVLNSVPELATLFGTAVDKTWTAGAVQGCGEERPAWYKTVVGIGP